MTCRFALALILVVSLSGCGISNSAVVADVMALERSALNGKGKIEIVALGPGEGDAEHAYYIANVIVTAAENLEGARAPFEGLALKPGQRSGPIRLEMLYAKRDGGWKLMWVKAMQIGTGNSE